MNEQDELEGMLLEIASEYHFEGTVPDTNGKTDTWEANKDVLEPLKAHISKNYIAKTETERWILEGRCSTIEHLAPYIDPKFKEHFELYETSLNDQLDKLTGESNG